MPIPRSETIYANRVGAVEQSMAGLLAEVAHFVHPDVVAAIREANATYTAVFDAYAPPGVRRDDYLFAGSDCVFPGVHRHSGQDASPRDRRRYCQAEGAILDDNVMPRHIWVFLARGTAYSGPAWKETGLNAFELAHLFPHKTDEVATFKGIWRSFPSGGPIRALFTSASSVILVPKGLAKPTDTKGRLLSCFLRRYLDLYGVSPFPGLDSSDLQVPDWYGQLLWQDPVLPPGWQKRVAALLRYRDQRLRRLMERTNTAFAM